MRMSIKNNILDAFGWFLAECKKKFVGVDTGIQTKNGEYFTTAEEYVTSANELFLKNGIGGALRFKDVGGWAGDQTWVKSLYFSQNYLGNGQYSLDASILHFCGNTIKHGIVSGGVKDASDVTIEWRTLLDSINYASVLDSKYQPKGSYAASSHNHNTSYISYQNANGYPGMGINGNFNNWIRTPQTGLIPYQQGGASSLGTSGWPFKDIYAHNIYPSTLLRANGEIQSTASNGFRIIYGNRGFFIRNDGGYSYFLLTNQGDPYGTFNNLRPLYINNASITNIK